MSCISLSPIVFHLFQHKCCCVKLRFIYTSKWHFLGKCLRIGEINSSEESIYFSDQTKQIQYIVKVMLNISITSLYGNRTQFTLYKMYKTIGINYFCECKQILLHIGYQDQTNISTILHGKFSNNRGNQYKI